MDIFCSRFSGLLERATVSCCACAAYAASLEAIRKHGPRLDPYFELLCPVQRSSIHDGNLCTDLLITTSHASISEGEMRV